MFRYYKDKIKIKFMGRDHLVNQNKYTYFQNRICRFCAAPIPDQEHNTREFCKVSYDKDSKVKDCKTSFHRERDKPERDIYANLIARHKAISSRIDFLIMKKGYMVTTEDLDTYEIFLSEAINYTMLRKGELISEFLKHTIRSNPISNIHKISINDK